MVSPVYSGILLIDPELTPLFAARLDMAYKYKTRNAGLFRIANLFHKPNS